MNHFPELGEASRSANPIERTVASLLVNTSSDDQGTVQALACELNDAQMDSEFFNMDQKKPAAYVIPDG